MSKKNSMDDVATKLCAGISKHYALGVAIQGKNVLV